MELVYTLNDLDLVAKEIIKTWLTTDFSQESRHIIRLQKVEDIKKMSGDYNHTITDNQRQS